MLYPVPLSPKSAHLRARLAALRLHYGPDHPDRPALEQAFAEARAEDRLQAVEAERRRLLATLAGDAS